MSAPAQGHRGLPSSPMTASPPVANSRALWAALSDAESAVARLAAEGKTNREIAEKLFISPHTVNTHLRHIFEKLDINSRVTLTRITDHREQGHTDDN